MAPQLAVGASPDDVSRLIAMLRVVGQFGHRLDKICTDAATALEELAAPAGTEAGGASAQQRDDDGAPPAD